MSDHSSLFGVQAEDVKPEKLPTIAQYVKANSKPKAKVRRIVTLVWTPGRFDNFTLQTDSFRVIVPGKHPFYSLLRDFFADRSTAEKAIGIEVTDWSKGAYMLYEPNSSGLWQELGEFGYRWATD